VKERITNRNDSGREDLAGRCKDHIVKAFGNKMPTFALVLGSGFQDVLTAFELEAEMPFSELPGFPVPAVKGHSGRMVLAAMSGMRILVCAGRAHYYEGHSMEGVMFPIEVLAECGVKELLLTNAAGGINRGYRPGDFMIFSDHINLLGVNPLRGRPVEDGSCFVDLSDTYCTRLRGELKAAARSVPVRLKEGVYIGVSGPSYETPAEIRAFRKWGADAVGMSTIPEVLMARYLGMRVAALSCITNYAAGLREGKLSHKEVLLAGRRNATNAVRLLKAFATARIESNDTSTKGKNSAKHMRGKEFEKQERNR
jgi:purine-nucleoside phosphorylase